MAFREVPNREEDNIAILKEWVNRQTHLNARTDSWWLLAFLRASKFSMEKAKQRIDRFYSARSYVPEIVKLRDPFLPEIQAAFDDSIAVVLPNLTREPVRIIFRIGTVDPFVLSYEGRTKVGYMIFDILLQECEEFSKYGLFIMLDARGITYKHIAQLNISLLRKISMWAMKAYPVKIKAIHIIHMSSIALPIKNVVMPLLPKKISSVINFHADDGGTNIYKDFPCNILPLEYGGQGPPLKELSEQLKLKVESYKDWYANDENYFCDETRRTEDSPIINELFGLDGCFRKLEID